MPADQDWEAYTAVVVFDMQQAVSGSRSNHDLQRNGAYIGGHQVLTAYTTISNGPQTGRTDLLQSGRRQYLCPSMHCPVWAYTYPRRPSGPLLRLE